MSIEKRANKFLWIHLFMLIGCLTSGAYMVNAQQPLGDPGSSVNISGENGNKMRLRSALRITKASRQPVIEIELYSDQVFPVRNAMHVLQIGKRVFHMSRYGDTKRHVLVFILTPEEFAKTKSGDEVTVGYQGDDSDKVVESPRNWKFGKLDKSKLDQ